jgi:hypothetical protein
VRVDCSWVTDGSVLIMFYSWLCDGVFLLPVKICKVCPVLSHFGGA